MQYIRYPLYITVLYKVSKTLVEIKETVNKQYFVPYPPDRRRDCQAMREP